MLILGKRVTMNALTAQKSAIRMNIMDNLSNKLGSVENGLLIGLYISTLVRQWHFDVKPELVRTVRKT